MIWVCDFSPVAFRVLDFPVHWYSLAYIAGIIFVLELAKHLLKTAKYGNPAVAGDENVQKTPRLPIKNDFENVLNYAVIGIIVGGRLGHVLFYDFDYYSTNPTDILRIWRGGMSFYGGFVGCMASVAVFCRINHVNFLAFCDFLVIGTPVGLGLGRITNFINGELIGTITDGTWGVVFRDGALRHPSVLYEAFAEGVLLFALLLSCFYLKKLYRREGILSAVFCMGYGIARFACEFYREPDSAFSFTLLKHTGLNFNQYLSFGIISTGIILLIVCSLKKEEILEDNFLKKSSEK